VLEKETFDNLKLSIYNNEIKPIQESNMDYTLKNIPKIQDYQNIRFLELKDYYLFYINIGHHEFIDYLRQNTNCETLSIVLNTIPIYTNGKYVKN
jgi:hypothetical protein